jgi:hypothetical protein
MGLLLRVVVVGACCALAAFGVVMWVTRADQTRSVHPPGTESQTDIAPSSGSASEEPPATDRETFPDPNAPGTKSTVFVDTSIFEGDLFATAGRYSGPVRPDSTSLKERIDSILARAPRGIADVRGRIEKLGLSQPPKREELLRAIELYRSLAFLYIYDAQLEQATKTLERALALCAPSEMPENERASLRALLGIVALRRGELDNCIGCVGPSSCIFPIAREAVHTKESGSREAVKHFTEYLKEWPGDLRIRWLLNVAYMTLGEYPAKVPAKYLVPLGGFESKVDVGRFENVAIQVGLGKRGPGLAGGSIFDDFTGDGLPDLFISSLDADRGAALFVNRGDGSFEDRSSAAGLDSQAYALNVTRADFDNDGNLDILLLRGGWERPTRLSLLRNTGKGQFEDVTESAGLGEPIATEAAAWADYDNDGLIDLYVCGEYMPVTSGAEPDSRNYCRLYHNLGNGKFADVAAAAGVLNERYAKGAAWADYDDDGRPDLFVSNMSKFAAMPCRLYHNEGNGTFRDVAVELGVTGPLLSFPTLWWDYDNDGRMDLFASEYNSSLAEVVAGRLGLPTKPTHHPRLYHNLGNGNFHDVSLEVGLDKPAPAMAVNCGDIDNDGYLDLHMGTGWMGLSGLVPDETFVNLGGKRFEEVTTTAGTGHLQKGHGVSFADWDCDGDLDFAVVYGGGYPGDKAYRALFQNPGNGRHWLKVKLVGTKTNRAAIGARIRAEIEGPDGKKRLVHRMIGTNGSFGGNTLVELIGLGDAKSVAKLTITWPTSQTTQTFDAVQADQSLEITEGAAEYKLLKQPAFAAAKP